MEQVPTKLDKVSEKMPLDFQIWQYFKDLEWVEDVRIRLRENGLVLFGEAFVIPKDPNMPAHEIIQKIEQAYKGVKKLDWKVHDITIQPVRAFHNK